jgi:glycosyltransferase involved in cell wall biosynthesis
MNDISIIVCCYNSDKRIGKTLEYLAKQKLNNLQCEVILVDNNCKDNTVILAQKKWKECGQPFPLLIVKENEPGLTNARKAGVEAAAGEVIIFCDDDNWLSENYLQRTSEILVNKNIGILGGQGIPVFEKEKPHWFDQQTKYFAVGSQGKGLENITHSRGCVYGAGMAFRKEIWTQLFASSFSPILSDRKGESLSSGGDIEFSYAVRLMGYELWYAEDLRFSHYMTETRMNENYLKNLLNSNIKCEFYLNPYLNILDNKRLVRIGLNDHLYFLRKILINGFLSIIKPKYKLEYMLRAEYFKVRLMNSSNVEKLYSNILKWSYQFKNNGQSFNENSKFKT